MWRAGGNTGSKSISLLMLVAAGFLFTGCLAQPVGPESGPAARVALGIRVAATDDAPGNGGEAGAPVLDRVVVTLTSSAGDVLQDTITAVGSRLSTAPVHLDPDAAAGQLLHPLYPVAPGTEWTFTVESYDVRDSLVHAGNVSAGTVADGDFRNVYVNANPRFARYEAGFPLPATAPDGARKVFFHRLVVEVDGAVVRDSLSARLDNGWMAATAAELAGAEGKRFFPPVSGEPGAEAIVLAHQYLRTGHRDFVFKAYGYLEGDTVGTTPERLLYRGGTEVEVVLGKTAARESVSLEWTGTEVPTGTAAGMHVRVGKVHTAVINVVIPGAVML